MCFLFNAPNTVLRTIPCACSSSSVSLDFDRSLDSQLNLLKTYLALQLATVSERTLANPRAAHKGGKRVKLSGGQHLGGPKRPAMQKSCSS